MKAGDFYSLGTTYYEMANFVKEEGKDNVYLLKPAYEAKLKFQKEEIKRYRKSKVYTGVEIVAATHSPWNNSCEECMKLNGKIFSIEEALSKNPLPVKNCGHECGCRCVYVPTID